MSFEDLEQNGTQRHLLGGNCADSSSYLQIIYCSQIQMALPKISILCVNQPLYHFLCEVASTITPALQFRK